MGNQKQVTLFQMLDYRKIVAFFSILFFIMGVSTASYLLFRTEPQEKLLAKAVEDAALQPDPTVTPEPAQDISTDNAAPPEGVEQQAPVDEETERRAALESMHKKMQSKAIRYKKLIAKQTDEYEWIGSKCNGLFWNSLYSTLGGWAPITEAQSSPGKWEFHPSKSCKGKETSSTINELNLSALLLYAYKTGDRKILEDLVDYGEKNNWLMGESVDAETGWRDTKIKDNLQNTIYMAREKILGLKPPANLPEWVAPNISPKTPVFYPSFELFVRVQIRGSAELEEIEWIRTQTRRHPNNGFLQAFNSLVSGGDFKQAMDIGLNTKYFPAKSLPSTKNRCDEFLFMDTSEPKPCSPYGVHPGLDFLFLEAIVNGMYYISSSDV
jgi:hypothetical protein